MKKGLIIAGIAVIALIGFLYFKKKPVRKPSVPYGSPYSKPSSGAKAAAGGAQAAQKSSTADSVIGAFSKLLGGGSGSSGSGSKISLGGGGGGGGGGSKTRGASEPTATLTPEDLILRERAGGTSLTPEDFQPIGLNTDYTPIVTPYSDTSGTYTPDEQVTSQDLYDPALQELPDNTGWNGYPDLGSGDPNSD